MAPWQYKTITRSISGWFATNFDSDECTRYLNEEAAAGWELVSTFAMTTLAIGENNAADTLVIIFRKKIGD